MRQPSLLIRQVTLLDPGRPSQCRPGMEIGIRDGRITAVRPSRGARPPEAAWDRVVDGEGRVAMPGLVNAHSHTYEGFTRGLIVNRPVGLWALYGHPVLGVRRLSEEEIYFRTLAACVEMLRGGVTTVYDDVSLFFDYRLDPVRAVLRAYRDAGMRAIVTIKVMDRRLYEALPVPVHWIPRRWKRELDAVPVPSVRRAAAFGERCFGLDDPGGLVRCGVNPSAPQRCSDALLTRLYALARAAGYPFFLHVQETKLQARQGPAIYGTSMVGHLDRLGLLGPTTGLIHGVWLSDEDIARLADTGASVIHNPVSNLRVGSGVAPLRRLLRAGVPVGLGTDGTSSNDAQSVLETLKLAAIVHCVSTPEYRDWLRPVEVYRMATEGGARVGLWEDRIGSIAAGRRADLMLLDAKAPAFQPWNAPINQLVYGAAGVTVDQVFVEGRRVVDGGRVTTVDEEEVWAGLAAAAARYRSTIRRSFAIARRIEPVWRRMYLAQMRGPRPDLPGEDDGSRLPRPHPRSRR
jgi:cytosine/adenosine deaminase-related metal-dependent hydrolase